MARLIGIIGKISLTLILTLAFSSALFMAALLTAVDFLAPPNFSTSLATVQNITAGSWLVFDVETGDIIYESNADTEKPIASVTKLIAAKTFHDHNDIWSTTNITWSDIAGEGRAGKLYFGDVYNFYTLFFPLLLESSNDAANVLERNDPDLVSQMNDYASDLGLKNTKFVDASGLSKADVSTAGDLAVLTRDVYLESRQLINISGLENRLTANTGWLNNNPFATSSDYVGGKHGYTPEADHTAVALFDETLKNGVKRVVGYVILDSSNLEYDVNLLRDHVTHNVSFE